MNLDEIKRELTYQAALTYYDEFDIKKVKVLFSDLMNQGVYHDEFIDIEDLKFDCSFEDFIIVFDKALKAINIAIPKAKNKYLEIMTEYKILPIIKNILNNKLGIIEASREILKTIYALRVEIEGLDIFKAIDSETDHLPIDEVRKHWNKDSLTKADAEIKEYEDGVRDEVRQACRKIINDSFKNRIIFSNLVLNDSSISETICRVCGYDDGSIRWELDNGKLYPSYLICECCGSESGYYDTIMKAIRSNREKWITNGAQWWRPKSMPQEWELEKQLAQIPNEYQ